MKKLDTTKMYDLRYFSDKQLVKFGKESNKFRKSFQGDMSGLDFLYSHKDYAPFEMYGDMVGFDSSKPLSEAIDARELFFIPK